MEYSHPNNAENITPSDTVALGAQTLFLSFSNSGAQTIKITTVGGQTLTITGLPSGIYPIRATQVFSTGTTVTNIVGYW